MAVLIILIAAVAQICLFYTSSSNLQLWEKRTIFTQPNANSTEPINSTLTSEFMNETASENSTESNVTIINEGIGVYDTIFLGIAGVIVVLSAIISGLLLHLCFFHIYISFLGLTTYEYIRNHRQSVNHLKIQKPSEPQTIQSRELYILSKVDLTEKHRPKTLHCCNVSRNDTKNDPDVESAIDIGKTSNTSHKSIFMLCTVLKETHSKSSRHEGDGDDRKTFGETRFHCCAEYSRVQTGSQKIVQVTEKCTFCSFRIKTPKKPDYPSNRCCTKTITKHHRWRRKWNCCTGVPLSPEDLPGITPVRMPVQIADAEHDAKPRYFQIEVPLTEGSSDNESNFMTSNGRMEQNTNGFKASVSIIEINSNSADFPKENEKTSRYNSVASSHSSKKARSKLVRPWPVRIRHMFRIINRYRHTRRGINSLKQNQIRPLPGSQSSDNISAGTLPQKSTSMTAASQKFLPSAPAPNRRKIKQAHDLSDMQESFDIESGFHKSVSTIRRQRRKNVIKNRSPTLSPIQESGLSNPSSPRMSCRSCTTICGHLNLDKPSSSTES